MFYFLELQRSSVRDNRHKFSEPDTFMMFIDGDRIVDATIVPDIKASTPMKEQFPAMPNIQVNL